MESIAVRIRFLSNQNVSRIVLPKHLCEKLQLAHRQRVPVKLGQRTVTAVVNADKRNPNSNLVRITTALQTKLGIPFAGSIHLKRENDGLRLGPHIGILTTGVQNGVTPVGGRSWFFRNLLSAQRGKGVYYFLFSPGDVNWTEKTVYGWFLRPTGKGTYVWKRQLTSFPDVVYDRISSRTDERSTPVQTFISQLRKQNIPMFNQGFFNKWTVYQLLEPFADVRSHIPETQQPPSVDKIRDMLKRHNMVYLKPKNGCLGYGIYRVRKTGSSRYELTFQGVRGSVKRYFSSIRRLYTFIFRSKSASNYLMQQGITLATFRGRPFDLRVHMHKNGKNEWEVGGIAAKVAGTGSVTTHVRTGGAVIPAHELLTRLYGDEEGSYILNNIAKTAIRICSAIEKAKGGYLGELGLDMGLDKEGHVWMFEANAKPGRSVFKHSRMKQADLRSRGLLVEYSKYLAGF